MKKQKQIKINNSAEIIIIAWMLIGYSFFIFYSIIMDIIQNYQMLNVNYDEGKSLSDLGLSVDFYMYAIILLFPVAFIAAGWGLMKKYWWARYLAIILLLFLAFLFLINQTVWPVFRIILPIMLSFCVFILTRRAIKVQ
ncbi:MAG: hypothetical protein KC733_02690, partial [Candidatus Omnitrophica bacterium]|nr:hypothetical protein [Candidatus Omnitrophota bacterium]